ncbi:MAG: 30S ribosomal protein S4 [Candidatus Staskawiczbacteria bacterium]|nr:30S ribosomal protein S4 [Candidatus Staskawiczbacteria bacterium]
MENTQFKNVKPTGGAAPEKKKRRGAVSEYKKSLIEKQTLKRMYGMSERQFKRCVKETLEKMGRVENVSDELIKTLEKRFDNVIYRLGFAKSRPHARQLVSHAYFLVNGKPVNIPSLQIEKEDVIAFKENKKKKALFKALSETKKLETPVWLNLNHAKLECNVIGEPSLAEVNPPVQIPLIFEFYSR